MGVPTGSPRGTHSLSCLPAPAPPRTRSGQLPWCPRREPSGRTSLAGLRLPRLRSGRFALGSSVGRHAGNASEPRVPRGARAQPHIAAAGARCGPSARRFRALRGVGSAPPRVPEASGRGPGAPGCASRSGARACGYGRRASSLLALDRSWYVGWSAHTLTSHHSVHSSGAKQGNLWGSKGACALISSMMSTGDNHQVQ